MMAAKPGVLLSIEWGSSVGLLLETRRDRIPVGTFHASARGSERVGLA